MISEDQDHTPTHVHTPHTYTHTYTHVHTRTHTPHTHILTHVHTHVHTHTRGHTHTHTYTHILTVHVSYVNGSSVRLNQPYSSRTTSNYFKGEIESFTAFHETIIYQCDIETLGRIHRIKYNLCSSININVR